MITLHEIQEQTKLFCGKRSQKSGYQDRRMQSSSGRGTKGAGNVPILIWGVVTQVYIYAKIVPLLYVIPY